MKFSSGGEKRKFFQYQRHFGRTQNIALAGFGLLGAFAPVVLILIVAVAVVALWRMPHHQLSTIAPALGMVVGLPFAKRGSAFGAEAERIREAHQSLFAENLKRAGYRLADDGGRRIAMPNTAVQGPAGTQDRQTGYIWDTLTVAPNTAFPAVTSMFTVPISGSTKPITQTNLRDSGKLSYPERMDVKALRLYILNNATPTDILALYTNVSFQLYVNNGFLKWEGLGWMIPAGGGLYLYGNQVGTAPAGSSVLFTASNGNPDINNVFDLPDIIQLGAGENFYVQVQAWTAFNTQANTTNPAGTGLTLVVAFEGDRFKPQGDTPGYSG
jgi:hypothetical protein